MARQRVFSIENILWGFFLQTLQPDIGVNSSNRDLRRFSTLKNASMDVGKTMSIAVASIGALGAATALKTFGAGGADKVILGGLDAAMTGNLLHAGAVLGAGYFIATGVPEKIKKIKAGAHCTFGKGNQKWYSGDDSLFV